MAKMKYRYSLPIDGCHQCGELAGDDTCKHKHFKKGIMFRKIRTNKQEWNFKRCPLREVR